MTSRGRLLAISAIVAVAMSASAACDSGTEPDLAATCDAVGELARTVLAGFTEQVSDRELEASVDRVVSAARASGEPSLSEPAERLAVAWERSVADDEAAPTAGFGIALNELIEACVQRGFTYPDIGWTEPPGSSS